MTNLPDLVGDELVRNTRSDLRTIAFCARLTKEYWLTSQPLNMTLTRRNLKRLMDTAIHITSLLESKSYA